MAGSRGVTPYYKRSISLHGAKIFQAARLLSCFVSEFRAARNAVMVVWPRGVRT